MIAITDVYRQVMANLESLKESEVENLEKTGVTGLRWTSPGGESLALGTDRFIAVDGIPEIIEIFEQLENEKLEKNMSSDLTEDIRNVSAELSKKFKNTSLKDFELAQKLEMEDLKKEIKEILILGKDKGKANRQYEQFFGISISI